MKTHLATQHVKPIKILSFAVGLACALLTLPGCMGLAKTVGQLKHDQATVVWDITTIYGRQHLVRTNPGTNHTVVVSPDGTVTINKHQ